MPSSFDSRKVIPPYNLSILDFKFACKNFLLLINKLIIFPYWILKAPVQLFFYNELKLIIYPYWILNVNAAKFYKGVRLLIIYPYWILNSISRSTSVTST